MKAYAVIGVRLSVNEFSFRTKRRGCEHKLPDAAKFCPTCGRPAFVSSVSHRKFQAPDYPGTVSSDEPPHYRSLIIPPPKIVGVYSAGNSLVVGFAVGAAGNMTVRDLDAYGFSGDAHAGVAGAPIHESTISMIRDAVRALLEPDGLWHEDRFGLWCVAGVE